MPNTIWVVIELEEGQPARSSLEVLGKAAQLGRAEAIVLGSAAAEVAPTLGAYGAEKVYVHADAAYDNYLTLPAVDTISDLLKQHQPSLLLRATTYDLRDIAARLNVRNNMGLITDATDLSFEGETLRIFDNHSTNNTRVNGSIVGETARILFPGDEIQIGRTVFILERLEKLAQSGSLEEL